MERVVIIGCAGAGKSQLAARVAHQIGAAVIDRDELLGPGQDAPEHRAAAEGALAESSRWVFDGTPFYLEDLVYPAADTVVFLDYSRAICVWRAFRRSLRVELTRRAIGPHLPVGVRGWLDPIHPVRWAWSSQPRRRAQLTRLLRDPSLEHATRVHLKTPNSGVTWLRELK
jgi:hypothetical protein